MKVRAIKRHQQALVFTKNLKAAYRKPQRYPYDVFCAYRTFWGAFKALRRTGSHRKAGVTL